MNVRDTNVPTKYRLKKGFWLNWIILLVVIIAIAASVFMLVKSLMSDAKSTNSASPSPTQNVISPDASADPAVSASPTFSVVASPSPAPSAGQ